MRHVVLCFLLAGIAGLLAPAGAGAAAQQFGSALTAGPNFPHGCEIEPGYFDLGPPTSIQGQADCTWRQSGVFGSLSDPRFSSVPGDGRIIRADVLSGNNPSPIRIVVIRQLGTGGFAGQCCFFQSETAPIPLAPNSITPIPLNIPVQRNTIDGVQATDLMAFSAQVGGSLPLRIVGSVNGIDLTAPGSVNAGFFYPRMGAIPNDQGGGRNEKGMPGVEVLIRWTWCASGDATCQGAGGVAPQTQIGGGQVAPALAAQLARVRAGSALIRLLCGGNLLCEGQLELVNPGAIGSARKNKLVRYGKKGYRIAAGKKATVKVKLNKKAKKLLKRKKKLKVGLRMTPKGGKATTVKLTLKR